MIYISIRSLIYIAHVCQQTGVRAHSSPPIQTIQTMQNDTHSSNRSPPLFQLVPPQNCATRITTAALTSQTASLIIISTRIESITQF
jgi:hypothetical protein